MESQTCETAVKSHVRKLVRRLSASRKNNLNINGPQPSDSGQINPAFSFENIVDEKRARKDIASMNIDSKFTVLDEDLDERKSKNGKNSRDDAAQTNCQTKDNIITISDAGIRSNFKPCEGNSNLELDFSNAAPEFAEIGPEVSLRSRFRNISCRSNFELKSRLKRSLPWRRASCAGSQATAETKLPGRSEGQRDLNGQAQDLRRSDYSLVSCGELTSGSLDVWRALPDQVKYDPALAPFRELYEKEHGHVQELAKIQNGDAPSKRLPFVCSAPLLNNNLVQGGDRGRREVSVGISAQEKSDDSSHHEHEKSGPPTMLRIAGHYIKMTSLLACWLFFTAVFMIYNERESVVRHSSVAPHEIKNYYLNGTTPLRVLIQLEGPFWSEQAEKVRNSSDPKQAGAQTMDVWLERWILRKHDNIQVDPGDVLEVQKSSNWSLVLLSENLLDFSVGETRSKVLTINSTVSNHSEQLHQHVLRIRTDSNKTTPFTLTYTLDPLDQTLGLIIAAVLLVGLYGLIIFEIINRTLAAVLTSSCALAALAAAGERPSLPELVSWLDAETLLLLFSMMLLVAVTAETGLFDFLAVFTFSVTKGRTWPLINLLCFFTATLSTFLDNVTTVLLMTPVTIRLCEVMQMNPVPVLMAMVVYSNIGGTATPVGDPPNVIIASNADVINAGINFANFTLHMTLGILLVSLQTYFQLRYMYKDNSRLRLSVPKEIQELRQQMSVWRRAAASLATYSRDEDLVRAALEKKVAKLDTRLKEMLRERRKRAVPADTFQGMLEELQQKYKIRDKALLIKSSIAIAFVVAVFFLHSIPELKRVSLGWTALLGAILLLILADRDDLESILNRVEWSTLLFFAALFVLMECTILVALLTPIGRDYSEMALSKLGLIQWIGGVTESIILQVDESARLAVSIVLMLWVSGLASAFVDNIPLTTMMVRVVTSLGNNPAIGLPMAPLIWALSFGACLGGNGTLIGASANVVTAGVAEQHGYRFSFVEFFKVGFPLMLGHLAVATVYLLLCHCVFTWH